MYACMNTHAHTHSFKRPQHPRLLPNTEVAPVREGALSHPGGGACLSLANQTLPQDSVNVKLADKKAENGWGSVRPSDETQKLQPGIQMQEARPSG